MYHILLIIILLLLLVYLTKYYILNFKKENLTNSNNRLNPFSNKWMEKDLQLAIKTLKSTVELFNQYGINYFIAYGTQLGYNRNKKVIPWDDDLDLIVIEHPDKVRQLIKNNNSNLQIVTHSIGFDKVFLKEAYPIKGYNWNWPFIDLFYSKIENDQLLVYNKYNTGIPVSIYKLKWVFPLKTEKYYQINVKIPNKSKKILKKEYGKEYKKKCQSSNFDHQFENKINKTYNVNCKILKKHSKRTLNDAPVYVINLKKRLDRKENTIKQLQKLKMNPIFIQAIDANSISDFYKTLPSNKISIGEVACGLSHIGIWKKIVKEKTQLSIIFEDDIIVPDEITYDDIIKRYNDSLGGDVVLLGYCGGKAPVLKMSERKETTFPGSAVCLHAYILTYKGAKRL